MNEPSREKRLESILHRYLQAVDAGQSPNREDLLHEHPDLADELRAFFADESHMDRLARAVRAAHVDAITIGLEHASSDTGNSTRIRYFGDYELLEELGRGGMGVVFQARQTTLNRLVALKMILSGQLASHDDVQRFKQEAEAAANLDHPNIAPIYEIGEHRGQHYFSMKLIEGHSLRELLPTMSHDAKAPRQGVAVLVQVARAVHHAHQRGVLHRDLKPANILLDKNGTPYVTDFGLAKRVEGDSSLTTSGAVLGTPSYMAPEQAKGQKHLSTAVDVYSLGAVLYELLCGRTPFHGATPVETLLQVVSRQPDRPSSVQHHVDRDLETIALKCLDKEPSRRYDSAAALADDLDRFLRNEPILARSPSYFEQAWRWSQRNPLAATLAAGLALVFFVGMLGIVWQWREAVDQRRLAEARGRENQQRVVHQYVAHGAEALERGQPLEAYTWFAEALQEELPDSARIEAHRRRLGTLAQQLPRLVQFLPHDQAATAVYSPDGRRLVTHWGRFAQLRDAQTGETIGKPLEQFEHVWTVVFSADSKLLAVVSNPLRIPDDGDYAGQIGTYQTENGVAAGPRLQVPKLNAWLVKFFPDSLRFIAAGKNRVQVHNVDTLTSNFRVIDHRLTVRTLAFSPDGTRLLVNYGDYEAENEIQLYDAANGTTIGEPVKGHELGPDSPFSEDGRYYVTFASDPSGGRGNARATATHLYAAATAELAAQVTLPHAVRRVLLLGPEPALLAHLNDERLHVGKPLVSQELNSLAYPVWSFAVGPEGLNVAAQRRDTREIFQFTWQYLGAADTLFQAAGFADQLVFSPDGQRLIAATRGPQARQGQVHLVDLNSYEHAILTVPHHYGTLSAQFHPDGRRFVSCDEDGFARVWDIGGLGSTLRPCQDLKDEGISALELSPDEKWLAIGQGHHDMAVERGNGEPFGILRVWQLATGQPVGPELRFKSRVVAIRFAPDGRHAVATLSEGSAAVVESTTGKLIAEHRGDEHGGIDHALFDAGGQLVLYRAPPRHSVNFPPRPHGSIERRPLEISAKATDTVELKEHQLVSASPYDKLFLLVRANRDAVLCSLPTGETHASLGRLHGTVQHAEFSRDGSRLVLVFDDEIAEIWDVSQRSIAARLIRGVETARFSASGTELLTGKDGVYQVWDATTGEPLSDRFPVGRAFQAPSMLAAPVLGSRSLISTAGDRLRIWNLATDDRPIEHLRELALVMSGHAIDSVGGYSTQPEQSLRIAWRNIAAAYPLHSPAPDEAQKTAWHEREAWQCRMQLDRNSGGLLYARIPAQGLRHHASALLAKQPTADRFWHRGLAHLRLDQPQAAADDFTSAIDQGLDKEPLLRLERARALEQLGQRAAAEADVVLAFELGEVKLSPPSQAWERRAAIRGLTQRLAQREDDWEALSQRADLAWDSAEFADCLRDLDQLIAASRAAYFVPYRRAWCLSKVGRGEEAIAAFTKNMGEQEDDPDELEGRAYAHARLDQFSAAADDLEKASRLMTSPCRMLRHAATMRLLANDRAGYRACCDRALDYVRQQFGANFDRVDSEIAADTACACVLADHGAEDHEGIVALARRGRDHDRDSVLARNALALALCRAGQPAEAIKVLADIQPNIEDKPAPDVATAVVTALAHHLAGDAAESSQWLATADRQAAERLRGPDANYFLAKALREELRPSTK